MKKLITLITIILSSNLIAQININGLLNKKADNSNASSSIEMLFSNKLNADGGKTGIEFKNEFAPNEDIYISIYLPKKVEKINKAGGKVFFRFDVDGSSICVQALSSSSCDGGYMNYYTDATILQYGLYFQKTFDPFKSYTNCSAEDSKYKFAKIYNAISNSPKTEVVVTVKLTNLLNDDLAHAEFKIVKKKGENIKLNRKFETEVKELNTNSALLERIKIECNKGLKYKEDIGDNSATKPIDFNNNQISNIRINSKDWVIVRDEYTKVILYRFMNVGVKLKSKQGNCFYVMQQFRETFDGTKYSEVSLTAYPSSMKIDVDCE
jgi:hypothetical protein